MNIDTFPSEEPGVYRPCAGAKQRQGCADRSQQHVRPGVSGLRDAIPHSEERNQRSCNRSPQTGHQEDSSSGGEHGWNHRSGRELGSNCTNCMRKQYTAGSDSQEQKTCTRPTRGERGE